MKIKQSFIFFVTIFLQLPIAVRNSNSLNHDDVQKCATVFPLKFTFLANPR